MPYRITIEKYMPLFPEYWTNIYWVNALDMPTAQAVVPALINAEKALYTNVVTITKARVDDGVPGTDVFSTSIHNVVGTRATPASEMMPLFVVLRVDFGSLDGGRPSRKYLRGVLWETDGTHASLNAPLLTLAANYGLAVVGTAVCDPQGFDLNSAAPWSAPAMRQLRRGSKRKVIP